MAQAIGGVVIAAVIYICSMFQFTVLHRYSVTSGCLALAIVVWLSVDSLLAGCIALVAALYALNVGLCSVGFIAIAAAVWAFVKWGLK
jgi:hypothetical protein